MLTEKVLKSIFNKREHSQFTPPKNAKESAVIVPFLPLNGNWHLIFEKKVKDNSQHAGQMAFPGGSKDKKDKSFLDTAIRETCEEIGICEDDLIILGEIKPTITLKTNFVIYPFAAIVKKPPPYRINKDEVEKLVFVPIDYLIKQHPFQRKKFIFEGKERITMVIPFEGEVIWGASARILDNFIPLLKKQWIQ